LTESAHTLPESDADPSGDPGGPETWSLDSLPPELDYFRTSEAYQVELTGFQGPMDLLLHLIEKDQVDIYDIPIAGITDQKGIENEITKMCELLQTRIIFSVAILHPSMGMGFTIAKRNRAFHDSVEG
jgi:hypothetical protein